MVASAGLHGELYNEECDYRELLGQKNMLLCDGQERCAANNPVFAWSGAMLMTAKLN